MSDKPDPEEERSIEENLFHSKWENFQISTTAILRAHYNGDELERDRAIDESIDRLKRLKQTPTKG